MLDTETKRRIDTARDILVGKVPDPKSQVEQITIALIYKFMDDMDAEAEELGGKRKFFKGEFAAYGWAKLMEKAGNDKLRCYADGIARMTENEGLPALFRDIFKNAYLPYRDPETLNAFLKIINEFRYDHSERLGDAFEYLLSVLGSQGDAGQFRTPRHIIDFMVEVLKPQKHETVLDPACGTAGFLISAYKHILRANTSLPKHSPPAPLPGGEGSQRAGSRHYRGGYDFSGLKARARQMRAEQTKPEAFLWELLRDRQLGEAKFRRQHQFGDYVCDFYCHEHQLVVECDGEVHESDARKAKDARRDAYLKSQGLTVLRFKNQQVLNDPETVLESIAAHFVTQTPSPPPSPSGRGAEGAAAAPNAVGYHLPSPSGRGAGGEGVGRPGDLLTPDDRGKLARNFRGYDISPDMVRLSLVNLYLHGFTDPHIYEYDSLTQEERWNELADVILANPPFMSPKGGIRPHKRFSIQAKRSEVLFVDYMAEHLTAQGRAGIIVPEGIIFQSQTAYVELRKMLVDTCLVAVISLPAGCFNPYSGVKTSILLLDKALAKQSDTIAFFKVENDGFGLGAQRRAIEQNDLPQVQTELEAYLEALRAENDVSEMQPTTGLIVPKSKVAANGDYNLSGERYREAAANTQNTPRVPISELCGKIQYGLSVPLNTEGTGFKTFRMNELVNGRCVDRGDMKCADIPPQEFAKYRLHRGDILFNRTNSFEHVGRTGIYDLQGEHCFASYLIRLSDFDSRIHPFYLNALMNSAEFQTGIKQYASRAIGQSNINATSLSGYLIPLPPLEVQKEIVADIEGYQKVIDGARAVLDHYRPHIPIHPDWPMVELSDVCEAILTGPFGSSLHQSDYVDDGIPVINPANIVDGLISTEGVKMVSHTTRDRLSEFTVRDGDIVIGRRGEMGRCGVVTSEMNGWLCGTGSFVIRLKAQCLHRFAFFQISSPKVKQYLEEQAIGVTMKNLNQGILSSIQIPLPPIETQRAIVSEIEAEQALVAANRELITRMEAKIQATLARVWGEEAPATLV